MSNWQKMAIGIASSLVVGLIIGYGFGASGKGALKAAAEKARGVATAAKQATQQATTEVKKVRDAQARHLGLLRCKEELLRGLVQMYANNFGIASQHLGGARARLKRVRADVAPGTKKRIDMILAEISQAHTLAMRLDPMVRVRMERLVELVHGLPGAR
ncbi:MAG: hypothetical protein JRH20_01835 [Deltaproteobacteria bacterium]|nr:hypothetical protein [Deltaproteobacteria bacterium]